MTTTTHIGRKAAENICHAFDYAKHIGQPLNHYATINLRGHQYSDELTAAKAFQIIRHKFRDWRVYALRKHGASICGPAYIYTLEAPDPEHPHANWVLHVPAELASDFRNKLSLWVARACGHVGPFDIDVQVVDPTTDKTLAKYVVKGTDPNYVEYLHLGSVAAPQGQVSGRRVGVSPAISRTARKRGGFVPRRDRHKWRRSTTE